MQALTCEGCGLSGVPTQVTFYQMQTGWKRMYPKSSSVVHRRAEQRFLCGACIDGGARTGMWEQLSLLS